MKVNCKGCANDDCSYFGMNNNTSCKDYTPLNPAPQQRTWIALTEDEMDDCECSTYYQTCKAIEAKLREKNNA